MFKRTSIKANHFSSTKFYDIIRHRGKRAVKAGRLTEKEFRDMMHNLFEVWKKFVEKEDENIRCMKEATTLNWAFTWSQTEQGFDYWDRLDCILYSETDK